MREGLLFFEYRNRRCSLRDMLRSPQRRGKLLRQRLRPKLRMTQAVERDTPTKAGSHFYPSRFTIAVVRHYFLCRYIFDASGAPQATTGLKPAVKMLWSEFRIAKPHAKGGKTLTLSNAEDS